MIDTAPSNGEPSGGNDELSWWGRQWKRLRRRQMRASIPYEGLAYMVILIMLMSGALLGKSNMLLLVFAFMAGPWIVNGALCYNLLRGVDLRRRAPKNVMAGEPFSVEVIVSNSKRFLSSWVLSVTDFVQHQHEQVRPRILFTRVPARSERSAHYQARLMHRGRYQLGPLRVSTRFPLGLAERSLIIQEEGEILVYPHLGELSPMWMRQTQQARELVQQSFTRRGSFDDEFHRLREYRNGDDPRSIHWRTSARQNELMVREFHQSREDDLGILLDLWIPSRPSVNDYRRVEYAISFAATVGYQHCLNARGSQLSMAILGAETEQWSGVAGPFAIDGFLEVLAMTEAGRATSPEEFAEQMVPQQSEAGRILFITTRPTRPLEAEGALSNTFLDRGRSGDFHDAYESILRLSLSEAMGRYRTPPEIIEADPQSLSHIFELQAGVL